MGSWPEATARRDLLEVAARLPAAKTPVDFGQLPYSTVLERNPNGPCDLEPHSECYDHGHKLQQLPLAHVVNHSMCSDPQGVEHTSDKLSDSK